VSIAEMKRGNWKRTSKLADVLPRLRVEELERQRIPPRLDDRWDSAILVGTPVRVLSSISIAVAVLHLLPLLVRRRKLVLVRHRARHEGLLGRRGLGGGCLGTLVRWDLPDGESLSGLASSLLLLLLVRLLLQHVLLVQLPVSHVLH
jgi:hypothetical protein